MRNAVALDDFKKRQYEYAHIQPETLVRKIIGV
jgi:hypothetical protein